MSVNVYVSESVSMFAVYVIILHNFIHILIFQIKVALNKCDIVDGHMNFKEFQDMCERALRGLCLDMVCPADQYQSISVFSCYLTRYVRFCC